MNASAMPAARVPVKLGVEFRKVYGRSTNLGSIKNISRTGAFLENAVELKAHDRVLLELSVSGRSRQLQALVIWQNEFGCGLQFQPENNRDSQIVDDLVYFAQTHRREVKGVLEEIFQRVA
jgi:hypothetical protein